MVIVFDLDDTLYDEIEFVYSGFYEVSRYIGIPQSYIYMKDLFFRRGSGKIFDLLIERYDLTIPLEKIIEVYRFHFPRISLSSARTSVLEYLIRKHRIALLTDGHYITQKNKFTALSLGQWIDFAIFSDMFQSSKPDEMLFKKIIEKYPSENKFIYIADNPQKDFQAPLHLGWNVVRYKNPRGIYRDIPSSVQYEVENFENIISIIEHLDGK